MPLQVRNMHRYSCVYLSNCNDMCSFIIYVNARLESTDHKGVSIQNCILLHSRTARPRVIPTLCSKGIFCAYDVQSQNIQVENVNELEKNITIMTIRSR